MMLALPTAVVTVVAAFSVYITLYKRRYSRAEMDELAYFTTWDAYSKFLVTWENNQAARAAE